MAQDFSPRYTQEPTIDKNLQDLSRIIREINEKLEELENRIYALEHP